MPRPVNTWRRLEGFATELAGLDRAAALERAGQHPRAMDDIERPSTDGGLADPDTARVARIVAMALRDRGLRREADEVLTRWGPAEPHG